MQPPKPHDPALCFCGDDDCVCPCPECQKRRERLWALKRRQELAARLEKAGIDIGDLADLIWMHLAPALERRIETMTKDALRVFLKDLRLYSKISGSSVDWQ